MRVCAKIDVWALQNNLQQVKKMAPQSKVLAMVKANAYGHGLLECAAVLDAHYLGVASLDEALLLREKGISKRIVLMGGLAEAINMPFVEEHALDLVVYHEKHLDLLEQYSGTDRIKVWFKIDTGMHRLGCSMSEAEGLLKRLEKIRAVEIEAVMTHLAVADIRNHPHTLAQLSRFSALTQRWSYPKSVVNSAGLLHYPEFHLDVVRPGLMLYGLSPCSDRTEKEIGIIPVMQFEAKVLNILEISSGEGVGYGLDWIASRPTKIAVVSVGYGDGYPQYPHPEARVKIKGHLTPIVGRVSMDFMMTDVTDYPDVVVNDSVILWDANHLVLSPYASLTRVMARVPRVCNFAPNLI
ncbi:MAG: alanine racemase [Gammaproteobacteria bacterium]|nr:alanine racemase [Gammaproteobacteria bacterium]